MAGAGQAGDLQAMMVHVPVIMTPAHADREDSLEAIQSQCAYYLVEPIDGRACLEELRRFGRISALAR